jgi:hypothetical protein
MSLVQAYISENYILVCGEQKATVNGVIVENFKKVYKLNDTTIIGMAGTIEGNYRLFSDYINADFSLNINFCQKGYFEIESDLINKFQNNVAFFQEHNVISIICGWDGYKMTGKTFFTNLDQPINNLTPNHQEHIRLVNCGLEKHKENAERISQLKNPQNLFQLKNLFRDVIDEGVKFDNTINKNINYEKIRRIDVDK